MTVSTPNDIEFTVLRQAQEEQTGSSSTVRGDDVYTVTPFRFILEWPLRYRSTIIVQGGPSQFDRIGANLTEGSAALPVSSSQIVITFRP